MRCRECACDRHGERCAHDVLGARAQVQLADAAEHPLPDETAVGLVHRPAVLRCGPVRRPVGLLLRLAQARAAGPSASARSLRSDESADAQAARSCAGRDEARRWPAEGSRVLRGDDGHGLRRRASGSARRRRRLRRLCPQDHRGLGGAPLRHDPRWLDDHRLLADRDGDGLAPARPRIRCPRHQRPPRLPPAPRRCTGRRLGRRPARAAEPRRRLDGAPAGRRRPRRRPRLRLHRAGARDLQPLREGRDRRRARGRARRVPGEGLGGRGPQRPRAGARHRRGQGPQRRGRRRRGGRAAHGALPLDAPEHGRRGGGRRERRGRGRGAVRRGRRRRGLLPRQGQGLHARLRRRAPLRAAARHRPAQVGRPRHRDEEGRRAPAADRRAREAALRRGRRAGRGRAARAGGGRRHQPAPGDALPRHAASAAPDDPRARPEPRDTEAVDVSDESLAAAREATTLDRVHAAMLLQAGGRTNALRALLKAEQERGPDFLRLANALSALYPKGSEEKRLLDAMLLAVPR